MVSVLEKFEVKMFESHTKFLDDYVNDTKGIPDIIEATRTAEEAGK